MATDSILQLEDLARRYDAQVLREYLLDQEGGRGARIRGGDLAQDDENADARPPLQEVYDLRTRCFGRLRHLLWFNFLAYWSTVAYCMYTTSLRAAVVGMKATPPLEAWLLSILVLGTQGTIEIAACICLARPARLSGQPGSGFSPWDCAAWSVGLGARLSILLDAQCLTLMRQGSDVLFLISTGTFIFAIVIFVLGIQLRLLCGLCCTRDNYTYDKPDLFFKGRDAHGMLQGVPLTPAITRPDEDVSVVDVTASGDLDGPLRPVRGAPSNVIKLTNCAHLSDLGMLHSVLMRLYVPIDCKETQEFVVSASSFSRCFCEDVVQCGMKFFFLMDCGLNPLVLVSLFISALQAVASCLHSSSPSWDLPDVRNGEDGDA